jgi:hypothetical protein
MSNSLHPTRRTLLASGVGLAAATMLPPMTARAAEASDNNRHITFTSWWGPQLLRGQQRGTVVRGEGLRIDRPTGSRAYTDPFGGGTAVTYEQASWLSPTVATPFGLQELIASWNVETPGQTWVEILVRGHDETGTLSGWYVLGRWCAKDPDDGGAIHRTSVDGQKTAVATVYTDTFHAYDPHRLRDYQLQVNLLRPAGSDQTPVVRMIGAMASNLPDDATVPVSRVGRGAGRVLDVPTFSQELHVGHYPQWDNGGEAWCSATSTAMVLKYWRTGPQGSDLAWVTPAVDAEVDFAARNVFDYTYDGAGNWPFNTAYAAEYGLEAYVTRLRSFTEAEEFVRAGIPLIISVSFEKDELDGAGYGTNGHLMVVAGFTASGDVVVNDPASHLLKDDGQVRTTYRRDQLENAWVPHSGGTVYVMHPRWGRLPQAPSEPNW